jgi:hypothetical protein
MSMPDITCSIQYMSYEKTFDPGYRHLNDHLVLRVSPKINPVGGPRIRSGFRVSRMVKTPDRADLGLDQYFGFRIWLRHRTRGPRDLETLLYDNIV